MKSSDQANGPVPTHSQIADIIEVDHARSARSVHRFAQQRTNNNVRAARFVHNRRAKGIVLVAKSAQPFG
jgi:hypothetical protein